MRVSRRGHEQPGAPEPVRPLHAPHNTSANQARAHRPRSSTRRASARAASSAPPGPPARTAPSGRLRARAGRPGALRAILAATGLAPGARGEHPPAAPGSARTADAPGAPGPARSQQRAAARSLPGATAAPQQPCPPRARAAHPRAPPSASRSTSARRGSCRRRRAPRGRRRGAAGSCAAGASARPPPPAPRPAARGGARVGRRRRARGRPARCAATARLQGLGGRRWVRSGACTPGGEGCRTRARPCCSLAARSQHGRSCRHSRGSLCTHASIIRMLASWRSSPLPPPFPLSRRASRGAWATA